MTSPPKVQASEAMTVTAAKLAKLVHGTIEGDPKAKVSRPTGIEHAKEGDFTFLDGERYEPFAYTTEATILMVNESFQPKKPLKPTLLRVKDVRTSLTFLMAIFSKNGVQKGVSEKAIIHERVKVGAGTSVGDGTVIEEGAKIGENCTIYPQVFIGKNARIGDGTILYPGVRVMYDCEIGDNCILHPNAVVGADGFGFAPQPDKTWKKLPHAGRVIIENNVEIGACTCVDRASMGETVVKAGVKLDNLIHVAHNVVIGENTIMAAQVGVAGSAKVGKSVQIGGQAGLSGHISVADGTKIQAQSGIASTVDKPDTALFGSPAIDFKDFIRAHVIFKKLPELEKRVRELEKFLKENGGKKV